MALLSVTTLTTAAAGTGKTFVRCAVFLTDDFLPNESGIHFSNFPAFPDKIVKAVIDRHPNFDETWLRNRVQLIPDEELEKWKSEMSGPWEYFENKDLDGAHIAIDEIHEYCSTRHTKAYRYEWQKWLGQLRHRGATFEGISQDKSKIADEMKDEAGTRLEMVAAKTERDPWFKILLGDWYELLSCFTGNWPEAVLVYEKRKNDGRWENVTTYRFRLEGRYFDLFDSHSAPKKGGQKKLSDFRRRWERFGRMRTFAWFFARNWLNVAKRFAKIGAIVWLLWSIPHWFEWFKPGSDQPAEASSVAKTEPNTYTKPATPAAERDPIQTRAERDREKRAEVEKAKRDNAERILRSEIADRDREAERLRETLAERAEHDRRRSEIVLMTPGRIVLRNGTTYEVGDEIRIGDHRGETLKRVDYSRRVAELSNGVLLGLGGLRTIGNDASKQRPDVRKPLHETGSTSTNGGAKRGQRTAVDALSRQNAFAPVRPVSR